MLYKVLWTGLWVENSGGGCLVVVFFCMILWQDMDYYIYVYFGLLYTEFDWLIDEVDYFIWC